MSEMSKAYTIFKRAFKKVFLSTEQLAIAKTAFKSGWKAREILLNKRVADIEKSATMKERERCAGVCQNLVINHPRFADLAEEIMGGRV